MKNKPFKISGYNGNLKKMSEVTDQSTIEQTLRYHELKTDLKLTIRQPYQITIRKGQDGYIVAKCSELHVVSQGKTEAGAIMDAVEFMESVLEEQGKKKEFSIILNRK